MFWGFLLLVYWIHFGFLPFFFFFFFIGTNVFVFGWGKYILQEFRKRSGRFFLRLEVFWNNFTSDFLCWFFLLDEKCKKYIFYTKHFVVWKFLYFYISRKFFDLVFFEIFFWNFCTVIGSSNFLNFRITEIW